MKTARRHRALPWMLPMLGACAITGSSGWAGSSPSPSPSQPASAESSSNQPSSASPAGAPPAASTAQLTRAGNCKPDVEKRAREKGFLQGTCWDPPGTEQFSEAVTVVPGRREIVEDNFWFEMPKEATVKDGRAYLPRGDRRARPFLYQPYDEDGGLPPFKIPALVDKTLAESLDIIDALDLPAYVRVVRSETCEKPHGVVCRVDPDPGSPVDTMGGVILTVSNDVVDGGTPKEKLRLRDLNNQPVGQVKAALEKTGFTSIEIVETDLPCERGLVCEIFPPVNRLYPKGEKIQLKVRRGKK